MHPSTFAISLRPEPYGSEGPCWVVAQAEAELVARYGSLDDGELRLTAPMFDPPAGVFLPGQRAEANRSAVRDCAPWRQARARSADCGSTRHGVVAASDGT